MSRKANLSIWPLVWVFLAVFALLQFCCSTVWSRPMTAREAQQAATGWLRADPQPLDTVIGQQVLKVDTFNGDDGKPVYYIVYLEPAGFVIMPADDLVEPIVGFADDGTYDPSPANPLGALVTNDLNGRIAAARDVKGLETAGRMEEALESQAKWGRLISLADAPEDGPAAMGLPSVSDVRVAPLVRSRWGQEYMCSEIFPPGALWYNYYTSYGYPCGCVATAMAQVMRYHEHPTSGIGKHGFWITVDDVYVFKYTRGGDGSGGPYVWNDMILDPDCGDRWNEAGARATGALCYDAGVSANMSYASGVSGAWLSDAKGSLTETFQYQGAVYGFNNWQNIGPGLVGMVNPNLDAKSPVMLGIASPGDAHAVVCDGYGYEYVTSTTMYHHLNMGWEETDDAWYNLPNIDCSDPYDSVRTCIYNIRPTGIGDGEVISGRVYYYVDFPPFGVVLQPIANATVYLSTEPPPPGSMKGLDSQLSGTLVYTRTDSRGIYAFSDVNSNTTYWITAVAEGRKPSFRDVTTGNSQDNQATSGNVWGADFELTQQLDRFYVDDNAPNDPAPGNPFFSDPFEDGSIHHPFDYIQKAINIAIDCNQIEVAPGTYVLPISFMGKPIRLYSSGGPEVTFIQGGGSYHVVMCENGEGPDTILDGFTITGGNANGDWPYCHGGGMWNDQSSPTVTNCIFTGNAANEYGGGMFNHYCSPTVTDCTFSGNWAGYGSGMMNYYSNPTVTNCMFSSNASNNYGGGMCNCNGSPTVTNCTFSGNAANEYGGGMYNELSNPRVTNCIFNENLANVGAGMFNVTSAPTVTNCIFWDDTPDEIYNIFCSPKVSYSDVEGGCDGWGNINVDPCFVDAAVGNLRLKPNSLCIDRGDSNAVPPVVTTDLDDHPRILDGDCNGVVVVDMGAYEFNYAYLGDMDYNCRVDFFDFSIFGRAWQTQQGDPGWDWACDISDPPDDYIDLHDVATLCDNWLATP